MTPWELVKKSEHGHQRAVFAWANCAARYGMGVADSPLGYALDTRPALMSTLQAVWDASAHAGFHPCVPRPELARLFAIHNQGHGDVIRGAMAKAEGVKKGVGDMMLPVPVAYSPDNLYERTTHHGLFIELKRPKLGKAAKGTESDEQAEWREYLNGAGYKAVVCVGWLEAVAALKDYLR